jgi:hypothetical protein
VEFDPMKVPWDLLVVAAGLAQLAIAAGSLAIPGVLRWSEDLARLRPLTRQVFWTYAGYIWSTNVGFGLVSALAPLWLTRPSPLGGAVCAYIATYWGARVVIQFTYFDRSDAPRGQRYTVAEAVLVGLFLFLTLVYGALALRYLWGAVP